MRLLPVWPNHVSGGAACEQSTSDGFRHQRRHVRQHLSLRDVHPNSRCNQNSVIDQTRKREMRADRLPTCAAKSKDVSRREFLHAGVAAGGGLMLSLTLPFSEKELEAAEADFAPNAFIRVGGDGQIALTMPYVEMGQG